jgi:hypothetical protein
MLLYIMKVQQEEAKNLDLRVAQAYQEYQTVLSTTDHHFFTFPLPTLLKQFFQVKAAWLQK